VASITDVASTTRYYLLQASTLTAPAAPTANPPGGSWQVTEPTYTEGSTNSLYTCDQTIFSDGTWSYSSVSLSTSYEAAKAAYNKAAAAAAAAAATDNHFWADTDGAHVSSTGDHDTSGFHQLMTSVKNAFMHGNTELMTMSANLIKMLSGAFELSVESRTISDTGKTEDIAHLKSQYLSLDGEGTDHGFSGLCASSSTGGLESAMALVNAQADGTSHADSTVLSNVQVNIGTGNTVLDAEMGVYGSGQTMKQFDGSATSFHTAALIAADAVQVGMAGDLVPISRLATAIQPVVLYDGYTLDNITLPESTANFSDIRIYYNVNERCRGSVDVHNPDGKDYVQMHGMFQATDTIAQYRFRALHIYGTHIDTQSSGYLNFDTSHYFELHLGDNNVYIERIIGWR
jgi:hypothetical protein